MKIQGNNYQERCDFQMREWVKGNSIHNNVENECTPDFSCCKQGFEYSQEEKNTYAEAYFAGDSETTTSMNMELLAKVINTIAPNKKYAIIGKDEMIITGLDDKFKSQPDD